MKSFRCGKQIFSLFLSLSFFLKKSAATSGTRPLKLNPSLSPYAGMHSPVIWYFISSCKMRSLCSSLSLFLPFECNRLRSVRVSFSFFFFFFFFFSSPISDHKGMMEIRRFLLQISWLIIIYYCRFNWFIALFRRLDGIGLAARWNLTIQLTFILFDDDTDLNRLRNWSHVQLFRWKTKRCSKILAFRITLRRMFS